MQQSSMIADKINTRQANRGTQLIFKVKGIIRVSMSDRPSFDVDERIDPNTIFEKDDESSADFEIAFAALVATAVLSFPNGNQSFTFVKLAAITLVLLTLLRRMSVLSSYSLGRKITDSSTAILLLLTYLCFLYLLDIFATSISMYLPKVVTPVLIMGVSVVIVFFLFIVVQEFLFRDLLLYASISAFNSGVNSDNEIYQQKFAYFAASAAKLSLAGDDFPKTLNWLRYSMVSEPESPTPLDKIIYYIGIILVLFLFLASWFISVGLLGGNITTVIVLAATLLVSTFVKFLYERYGLTPLISERRTRTDASALVFGFLLAVWLFV
jgi:hypothetical protein